MGRFIITENDVGFVSCTEYEDEHVAGIHFDHFRIELDTEDPDE